MSVIVRRATAEDIKHFAKDNSAPTLKAWVGEEDGELIAIGGLAFSGGRWFAFVDLKDPAYKYKYRTARTAKRVMDEARNMGLKFVYAGIDPDEKTAVRWMESLGFERRGDIMRWENKE